MKIPYAWRTWRVLVLVIGICAVVFAGTAFIVDSPKGVAPVAYLWLLLLGTWIFCLGRFGCLSEPES